MKERKIKIPTKADGTTIDDDILVEVVRVATFECLPNSSSESILETGLSYFRKTPCRQSAIEAAAQLLKYAQEHPAR